MTLLALTVDLRDLTGTGAPDNLEIPLQRVQVRAHHRLGVGLQDEAHGFSEMDTLGIKPGAERHSGDRQGQTEKQSQAGEDFVGHERSQVCRLQGRTAP